MLLPNVSPLKHNGNYMFHPYNIETIGFQDMLVAGSCYRCICFETVN
jgi:hypothetical protein